MKDVLRSTVLWAATAFFGVTTMAFAQPQPAPAKPGLTGALADEQRLISELSRRNMRTLLEYAFAKHNVPESQRKIYLTISSLSQLNQNLSDLPRRQQQELIATIAGSIDQVLLMTNDSRKLLELNAQLVQVGTLRSLNLLEYWGENPRTQYQLRPIAEAVDRVYEKAIALAQSRSEELAAQFKDTNDPRIKEWESLQQLIATAKFNSAFNKYALALSIDRADPQRGKIAQVGIDILREFEDPQYEVQAAARNGIAKLNLAMGTAESLAAAKRQFAQVLDDPGATWDLKFQAMYFTAIGDLLGKNPAGGRTSQAALVEWLEESPPANEDVRKGTEAAMAMLAYRIRVVEAEASPEQAEAANAEAVALLQDLMAKRSDLASIINEQLAARLPDNPDLKALSPMLLRAIISRGDEEIRRPEGQPVDRRTLAQAIAAAEEVLARAGKPDVAADDLEIATLELGFFYSRLGEPMKAIDVFLGYLEKKQGDMQRLQIAFDNAAGLIARLKEEQADNSFTSDAHLRLLEIATAAPFNRHEYAFEFGRLLLEQNISLMQGSNSAAQAQQMRVSAQKAAGLFRAVPDEKKLLHARYFEMLAYNQMIDLLPSTAPDLGQYVRQAQDLADEVNALLDQQMPRAGDDAEKNKLRWFRVRTALLAADLAKHDRSDQRDQSLRRALSLLANFEKDVVGMPNADNLLGEALFIRINALMSLRQSDAALDHLGRFLETRTGDDGIRIIYEMLESLNKEFQQAQQEQNAARMAELAGHRAKVSGYLVERVAQSGNPELRKVLPKYRMFEAGTLQQAAALEKDEGKRKEYLGSALGIFQAALKNVPEDKGIQLNIALVQYDLGDYAGAQPVLVKFLTEGWVGKPKAVTSGPEGERLIDNNQYWEAMHRLLRCNVALAKAKASGYDHARLLDETRLKLKQLYIQWGRPGGSRWAPQFDALRQEILPEWTPPVLNAGRDAATRPVEQ